MKQSTFIRTAAFMGLFSSLMLQGCIETKTSSPAKVSSIQSDTLVTLKEGDQNSPKCKISVDFMYLEPGSENDSVSGGINSILQRMAFGANYSSMQPSEAVSKVISKYAADYQKELVKYYEADIHNGMKPDELPAWYNYEYEISSYLKMNNDSIWNYSVTAFQYTGGAHPNTIIKWSNILASSGKELTKDMVFKKSKEKEITALIMKHLIKEVNTRLETDTITSVDGLRENGALLDVDLYIPDNFMLEEDHVSFLYNRYDIAPYAMGEFIIEVPYAEIETMMRLKD